MEDVKKITIKIGRSSDYMRTELEELAVELGITLEKLLRIIRLGTD